MNYFGLKFYYKVSKYFKSNSKMNALKYYYVVSMIPLQLSVIFTQSDKISVENAGKTNSLSLRDNSCASGPCLNQAFCVPNSNVGYS